MDRDLLQKYLAGEATDEEREQIRAAVEADPALVDAMFDAAELERDLGEVLREATPRRRLWIGLSAAAALVAGAVFYFTGEPTLARVELVEGKNDLAPGDRLKPGDSVDVSGGRVVLRYEDGTRLDLGPKTTLRDLGPSMTLARGTLAADVMRQSSPMVIRTPQGEARVLGTRFRLAIKSGATRLDVEKGQVRLTRLSDGKTADVVAGQFAVASTGAGPVARTRPSTMAPSTWLSVPASAMSQAVPDREKFPKAQGISGPSAVIHAWSGAAFDSRRYRLVLWGGGFSDYHGNELYAFSTETLTWERLNDPHPNPRLNQEKNDDGTPNGRATYNGLAYHVHADRFFAIGGAVAGNGFGICRTPWMFDFDAKTWTAGAPAPSGNLGGVCSYDPATRKIWWGDKSGIYSYEADRWTKHGDDEFYYLSGAIDTKRGLWVLVGKGRVIAFNVRNGNPARQDWKTTGGEGLLAWDNPGVDYDPVRDRIVAWSGGAVYSLDPETKTWTATDAPGAPERTKNGIFGRWRYVAGLDAFVVVTAIDQNVHFFKPGK